MGISIMTPREKDYQDGVIALSDRILALIPAHPEIMQFNDVYQLFQVPGFKCDDLGSSSTQASIAMARARRLYEEQNAH